jgi:hypothetical protein
MKTCGHVEEWLQAYETLALDGCEWSANVLAPLLTKKEPPVSTGNRCWMGPRAHLDDVDKRQEVLGRNNRLLSTRPAYKTMHPTCVFVAAETCLPSRCWAKIRAFQELKEGYTDSKVMSYASFCFFQNKETRLENLYPLPEIEPLLIYFTARSLVTVRTEPTRLIHNIKWEAEVLKFLMT